MKSLEKLIGIASPAFVEYFERVPFSQALGLEEILRKKNGFFAFESALRIFSTKTSEYSYSLEEWNSIDLWRKTYGELVDGLVFFAEDIFGGQFCIKNEKFYSFDPETADLTLLGESAEEWSEAIVNDYDVATGYSLAHEWQSKNGLLKGRHRLMPKIPFVCGGEFEVDNLISIESARSMRCRGNLAVQIQNIPDGEQVEFIIVD